METKQTDKIAIIKYIHEYMLQWFLSTVNLFDAKSNKGRSKKRFFLESFPKSLNPPKSFCEIPLQSSKNY